MRKRTKINTFFDVGTMERPVVAAPVKSDVERAIILAIDNARSLGLSDKTLRDEFVRRLTRRRRRRGAVDPLQRLADALVDAFAATAATGHPGMGSARRSLAQLLIQTIEYINESRDTVS